jgi:hypothetical protein
MFLFKDDHIIPVDTLKPNVPVSLVMIPDVL